MDKNFKVIGSRIYYTESMRDLGAARFILGGVILIFGLFFIWIELYIVGIPISVFAILLMEHCTEVIIDKENGLLIKKTGWIKPFLTLNKQSLEGVVSVSMNTVSTKRRAVGRVGTNTSISYQLFFDMPDGKRHINTIASKTEASQFATEIARMLDIEFIKEKTKSKTVKDD